MTDNQKSEMWLIIILAALLCGMMCGGCVP